MVMQIVAGEIEEGEYVQSSENWGDIGGVAYAKALSPRKRKSVTVAGIAARW